MGYTLFISFATASCKMAKQVGGGGVVKGITYKKGTKNKLTKTYTIYGAPDAEPRRKDSKWMLMDVQTGKNPPNELVTCPLE
jgi:hypothetical protein